MKRISIFLTFAVLAMAATQAMAEEAAAPTFTRNIAPVVFENCTRCHRPGEAAPFSLQSYTDVKKRSELIDYTVSTRLMPPWKAAKADYAFKHERRLTDEQIKLIHRWIEAGMPEGESRDLPPLPTFPTGWQLGEPDLIVTMPQAFDVPADGPDVYRNFVLPLNLTEDRWVRAVEFRPSAPTVVHHSLFFFDATGRARTIDAEDAKPGFGGGMGSVLRIRGDAPSPMSFFTARKPATNTPTPPADRNNSDLGALTPGGFGPLGGWALGAQPQTLPQGLAFRLPAGADLILSTHFHPTGKAEHEASTIGLYFADKPAEKRFTGIQLPPAFGAFKGINIPAGEKEYAIEDSYELPVDVRAFAAGAHAHYLGKSMTMTATLPSGEVRTLLSIPDWDFAWQEQYTFADYIDLPKGTKLHCRVTYDNSVDNPRNPSNPPQRVFFGEQSTNEMGSVTLAVVARDEAEFPALQANYRQHFRDAMREAPPLSLLMMRLNMMLRQGR